MAMLHTVRVYLGSDHAGFELKVFLVEHLTSLGHDVVDVGPDVFDPDDDYPPFCIETARRVVANPGSLGVVIGGSGNGEQISANKVPGSRASLAVSVLQASAARAPFTLLAAICSPLPDPPMTMASEPGSSTAAWAAAMQNGG